MDISEYKTFHPIGSIQFRQREYATRSLVVHKPKVGDIAYIADDIDGIHNIVQTIVLNVCSAIYTAKVYAIGTGDYTPINTNIQVGDLVQFKKKDISETIKSGILLKEWCFGFCCTTYYVDEVIHYFPANSEELEDIHQQIIRNISKEGKMHFKIVIHKIDPDNYEDHYSGEPIDPQRYIDLISEREENN